jgi:LysR family transcriptional regulator, carnitine catabolism transcriptional activator
MLPTLRQLEASALVYRLGSLTEAAAKLCIARCAISLLIRQIEEVAQVRLFDGTTRALRPTPACHEAVTFAERILSDARGLAHFMPDVTKLKSTITFEGEWL